MPPVYTISQACVECEVDELPVRCNNFKSTPYARDSSSVACYNNIVEWKVSSGKVCWRQW